MVCLIEKEFVIDAEGRPVKCGVYLAGAGDVLPADAPVGSRAILDNGEKRVKTPSGWSGSVTA